MRKHILLALIIASLVLAACTTPPAATPTPAAPAPTEAAPAAEETAPPAGEAAASAEVDAEAAAAEAALLQAKVAQVMANPWKWTAFTSTTEDVTVETPASYMVTFKEDGTVDIKADCNDASGTYTMDGINVAIEVDAATWPPARAILAASSSCNC